MSSIIFFLFFIPILSLILLSVNFIFAPHKPYKEKKTPFECGYHSFSQTRSQFSISFFLFAYVFLLLDIEIILLYPFPLSATDNTIYGLFGMIIFTTIVTVGFVFELGKEALKITSKQYEEFPPDPYGFISSQKISAFILDLPGLFKNMTLKPSIMTFDPVIWQNLSPAHNIEAIRELNIYLDWAIKYFHESIIEYDFVMKTEKDPTGGSAVCFFETRHTPIVTVPRFMPPQDSPIYADRLYKFHGGKYNFLSLYRNNNMGIPALPMEYRLIQSVLIHPTTGLDPKYAPVDSLTENWETVQDKIYFNGRGLHAVSVFYELIRSTTQNICAHVKFGNWLIEKWKSMSAEEFLDFAGNREFEFGRYWGPCEIDLFSIMKKQGFEPTDAKSRDLLKEISDNASSKDLKDMWIKYYTYILQDEEKNMNEKCKLINDSTVLRKLALEKITKYNHKFSNWPINPPKDIMIEFTAPIIPRVPHFKGMPVPEPMDYMGKFYMHYSGQKGSSSKIIGYGRDIDDIHYHNFNDPAFVKESSYNIMRNYVGYTYRGPSTEQPVPTPIENRPPFFTAPNYEISPNYVGPTHLGTPMYNYPPNFHPANYSSHPNFPAFTNYTGPSVAPTGPLYPFNIINQPVVIAAPSTVIGPARFANYYQQLAALRALR